MCASMVQMDEEADALADAVEAALAGWVERGVRRLVVAYRGVAETTTTDAARAAGQAAVADVGPRLRALLAADIDQQWTNPLSVVREAVRYPTEVLASAGVPPVERDDFARERFPEDEYDLMPASFADVDPALVEPGLVWGAAKAMAHRARHGAG
ncbi:MAG: hypothetical protein ABIW46_05010 [Acidimicrobiales bacterium]